MVGHELAALIIPPALQSAHRDGLSRYLRTGRGPIVGRRVELTAKRKDGSEFPIELVVTRPETPGERVFYGYLRDLTARNIAEAQLHRLADEQAALRRVATAVAAENDPSELFALVGEEVGRLLDAQTAHMFRFDPDGRGGTVVGGWALRAEHVLPIGTRMPLDGDTAVTRVWRTGSPARMENYGDAEGELASIMRGYGVRSVIAAPVMLGGSLWGAVVVSTIDRDRFPEDAEQRIAYFAELAAQALANAQAREDLAASRARIVQAGDDERRRLERNLHDGAQQRLVSLALMLRLAARRHPDDTDLERAGEELAQALQELRELARGIHPAVLTERGLEPGAARGRRSRAAAGGTGRPARGAPARPGRGGRLLRRLRSAHERGQVRPGDAREGARLARLRRRADRRRRRRRRRCGARPRPGLRGLADRVEALGGHLEIDSPAGAGTTLRASIPL